jgi:tetratricopeptide (TPR) repeat protein
MRRWSLLLALTAAAVCAQDRWVEIRSGPFDVLSNAGDKPARDALNRLEQVRHLLGTAIGKPDLASLWPVRVVVRKGAPPVPLAWTRDACTGALTAGAAIPPEWMRELVRLLLEWNARRMPAGIEKGVADFYSTADAVGTKVTLGRPPARRSLDWARIHLLVTNPEYSGKLRVLLYNLAQGADPEPAYRNAFAKTEAQIDKEAAAQLASASAATVVVGGRPLDPQRDFHVEDAPAPWPQIVTADLTPNEATYLALRNVAPAAAHEGLGFVALAAKRADEARQEFAAAAESGSSSARAWLELGRLDPAKARAAFEKAATLNPRWAEPHALLAEMETDPSRKLNELKTAAQLDPRNAAHWRAVAGIYLKHNRYPEAAKAWAAAEAASVDEAGRERIREARRSIEERRLNFDAAERRRREEQKQRDLQTLKDQAMARVRAAEQQANAGAPPTPPNRKIVDWDEGPKPAGKARGKLTRIDCANRVMRAVVDIEGAKPLRLVLSESAQVSAMAGEEIPIECGVQKPVRTVVVTYHPKKNAKLGTDGDVATMEFLRMAPE